MKRITFNVTIPVEISFPDRIGEGEKTPEGKLEGARLQLLSIILATDGADRRVNAVENLESELRTLVAWSLRHAGFNEDACRVHPDLDLVEVIKTKVRS